MTTRITLGNLANLSPEYKQMVRDRIARLNPNVTEAQHIVEKGVNETVQQKRKRLFNRDTGSLQLDLSGVPFWVWDEAMHQTLRRLTNDRCCLVDILGRPVNPKTGEEQPLFPYEYEVIRALYDPAFANPGNDKRRNKHIAILKARGAGATELIIYDMLHKPLCFPQAFQDSQMAVITGVRKPTAIRIIKRMKQKLYQKLGIVTDFSDTVLDINGCIIEAYPATNPESFRGLHNLKYIFHDESDYTPRSIIEDTFASIEGYWAKNNPYTIFNSTAREPGGLMDQLMSQPDETSNYKKIRIFADKLVGYIYTQEEIDQASTSATYRREYWGEFKGEKGNLFPTEFLDYAAGLIDELVIKDTMTGAIRRIIQRPVGDMSVRDITKDPRFMGMAYKTNIGTDPAFNASVFSSVVFKEVEGIVYAVHESELQSPSYEEAIELQKRLMYQDFPSLNPKIWIDAAATLFINSFKHEIKDYPFNVYADMTEEERLQSILSPTGMTVCPIPFGKYGDRMNYHFRRLMELGAFRIDKDLTPLLWLSMNSAKYDEISNKFNKKGTLKNDTYDAGRLATCGIRIGNIGVI